VIYLDASVVLAQLLAEDRFPPASLWAEALVSSRLLEYEVWTRIHARRLAPSHGDHVRALLARIALLELSPVVLQRALEPFPTAVRTLDALHLAAVEFLRARDDSLQLASYDVRQLNAAKSLGIPFFQLES
jgi:predicted nucleic acid-binding protein